MPDNLMACGSTDSLEVEGEAPVAEKVAFADLHTFLPEPGYEARIVRVAEEDGLCHQTSLYCPGGAAASTVAMLGAATLSVDTSSFVREE